LDFAGEQVRVVLQSEAVPFRSSSTQIQNLQKTGKSGKQILSFVEAFDRHY
jgi:hypothetical protein